MKFLDYVSRYARLIDEATASLTEPGAQSQSIKIDNRPKILLFAPHPDDEAIIGGLPLRLSLESGFQVINVPVTLGSDVSQRPRRKLELTQACRCLGFALQPLQDDGFSDINPLARINDEAAWADKVLQVSKLIASFTPCAIIFPHDNDGHPTHIGVHHLVMDALHATDIDYNLTLFQTEFWHPMTDANLMIESSEAQVAQLIEAIACHMGEVQRNPYHLSQPSWMIDNARRGSELIHGFGEASQPFRFATLYKRSHWNGTGEIQLAEHASCANDESVKILLSDEFSMDK